MESGEAPLPGAFEVDLDEAVASPVHHVPVRLLRHATERGTSSPTHAMPVGTASDPSSNRSGAAIPEVTPGHVSLQSRPRNHMTEFYLRKLPAVSEFQYALWTDLISFAFQRHSDHIAISNSYVSKRAFSVSVQDRDDDGFFTASVARKLRTSSVDRGRCLSLTRMHTRRPSSEACGTCSQHLCSETMRVAKPRSDGLEPGAEHLLRPDFIWAQRPWKSSLSPKFEHARTDYEHFGNVCVLYRMGRDESANSVLRCGLMRFAWGGAPAYTYVKNSLSFSPLRQSRIQVNGSSFWIPQALEVFLRSIRSSTEEKYLFVWPICMGIDRMHAGTWGDLIQQRARSASMDMIDAARHLYSLSLPELDGLQSNASCDVMSIALKGPGRAIEGDMPADKDYLTHTPLDPVAMDKRLVVVELDARDDFTPLRLRMGSADGESPYAALSYCWGPSAKKIAVEVNGCPMTIGQSLHDFLVYWRRLWYDRGSTGMMRRGMPIWIDALSINQQDDQERAREVRRMSAIYSQALMVIVWLGREVADVTVPDDIWRDDDLKLQHFNATVQVLTQPYFQRAWCTQELVCAVDTVTIFGGALVPWKLVKHLHVFQASDSTKMTKLHAELLLLREEVGKKVYDLVLEGALRCNAVELLQRAINSGGSMSLLTLLQQTILCECTVPSDKIYSLWSLAHDAESLLHYPDYSLEPNSLFASFVRAWAEFYDRLDILAFAGTSRQTNHTLPSWISDWTKLSFKTYKQVRSLLGTWAMTADAYTLVQNVEKDELYHADGDMPSSFSFSEDGTSLHTIAVKCDTIQRLATDIVSKDFDIRQSRDSKQGFRWLKGLCNQLIMAVGFHPDDPDDAPFVARFYGQFLDALILGRHPNKPIRMRDTEEVYGTTTFGALFLDLQANDPIAYEVWFAHIRSAVIGRTLAFTQTGLLGLVPVSANLGDELVIIPGCKVPLLVRLNPFSGTHTLIGECYFAWMMDGQYMQEDRLESLGGFQEITFV